MELIFNEQSTIPCAKDQTEAYDVVMQFVKTYQEAEKHDFKRIRYEKAFDCINIAPDFTLNDFCCNTKFRTIGGLLLGLAKHPFIDDNSPEEARFIENNFFIKRNNCEIQVEGLGIAYLYNSIGISFCFDSFWNQTRHRLYVKGKEAGEYDVVTISHPRHCNTTDFINHKDLWKPIELIESQLIPESKSISLRDDHGKDKLQAFASKLCQSPYVIEIVNSLPYNPHETQFIRSVKDNGLIEIVLTNTDKGLGLVLRSTGRNKRETEKIANILKENYS
ncbi:MAG: hypothetical protein ACLU30_12460 [Odoribacter splanchnicus]